MRAAIQQDAAGRKAVSDPCAAPCPIERGMRILGGKWTGSILWHLKDEPVRFNDLARMIGGASKKMIAERLKHLEAQGLVRRRVVAGAPFGVDYALTPLGETALDCLDRLRLWSEALPVTHEGGGQDSRSIERA
ncbi:MAG: helix-turn-helix domain-containing protein [Pseudomonadota bacterium]